MNFEKQVSQWAVVWLSAVPAAPGDVRLVHGPNLHGPYLHGPCGYCVLSG
jgi:hypothetical protein